MKVTVPKEFGNTAKKPVLPLVPEEVKINRKEDLTSLILRSDPTRADSATVKFSFKILEGVEESPREIIQWRLNIGRAFTGLDSNTGTLQHQMMQQFTRGTAQGNYNTAVTQAYELQKAEDVKAAKAALAADDKADAAITRNLAAAVAAAETKTQEQYLGDDPTGKEIVKMALEILTEIMMPKKILQRAKRYMRREARKPIDMSVKSYMMHLQRINNEELPMLPPKFDTSQCLAADEMIDVLLFGTPKSWQREMDRQGFDPLTHTPNEVVAFMERIEMSEDFDGDKKVAKVNPTKGKKKTNNYNNNSSGTNEDGSKYCMLHGKNNTHNTDECKTLKADVKKRKGNDSNGSKNKTWKNSKDNSADASKKELAALTKKIEKLSKKVDLNALEKKEPVRKRKVNYPTAADEDAEMDLAAIDAELKNFNYGDLDQMDIKEDGEVSVTDEISV